MADEQDDPESSRASYGCWSGWYRMHQSVVSGGRTMSRGVWATALLFVVVGVVSPATAQPLPPIAPSDPLPASVAPLPPPPVRVSRPQANESILGAPTPVRGEAVHPANESSLPPPFVGSTIPIGFNDPPAVQKSTRAVSFGVPTASTPIPSGAVEQVGRTTPAPQPADPVNDFLTRRSGTYRDGTDRSSSNERPAWKIGEQLEGLFDQQGERFRSDHAFDGFISTVTNPFLFEDPRSLTELRPIFIYQKIPSGQPDFRGGSISYFGVQGRVAITDRLSFIVNKFGGVWVSAGSGSPIQNQSGFSELWFGPKYTFIRNEQTGSLLAGGLQFQIPTSSGAFQNTGSLSLVPWATYGQSFLRDLSFGSFNGLVSTGYSFSTTNARSDYWYLSGHIDLDVANWHRFYPLFEMNYFLTTTNGNTRLIGVEGRDLINFGGQAKGHGLLTGAFGARFKISESAQFGGAFEIPFAGPKDLFQYRFTIDFILRY